MKQFDKAEQIKFWKGNAESFKADLISKVILSLSRPYIGKKVIDSGAGSGALLKDFKRKYKNKNIIGVDLVPKGPNVEIGDCTDLKFDSGSFDTYFCTDVIEHLSNDHLDKCLSEANRVLKIGGHAIFTTLYNENLNTSTVTCPECECKFHRWGHCQSFTISRIKKLFSDKGFKLVKVRKTNLGLLFRFRFIANMIYFFHFDKFLKLGFLNSDLFFVVKKIAKI